MSHFETRSIQRILDASANRCREGLRVLEEYVRFHREDAGLTEQLKALRHQLQGCLSGLRLESQLHCRDTAGDVGTGISLPSERSRQSLLDVLRANAKRVEESLRVLEEYGKLICVPSAMGIEALRYRFYDLEKQILGTPRDARQAKLNACHLYLLIAEQACLQPLDVVVRESAAGGVGIFQLRDKHRSDREVLVQARVLRELTRETDSLLVINDRPDIAVLCEADGVHVGQEELSLGDVRRIVGSELLIGISTHSLDQACRAEAEGADYIGVGPVFPSGTKPFAAREYVGPGLLREVAARITIPWFAIGGIDSANGRQVAQAGGKRVAVSQVLCRAEHPRARATELSQIFFADSGTETSPSTS